MDPDSSLNHPVKTFEWGQMPMGRIILKNLSHAKLKELLGEPGELFRHMAPSAPSNAPLVLYVAAIMAPSGAIQHIVWLVCIDWGAIRAYGSVLTHGATNGSPTWARLITEQWLLLRSQNGSFTFMCVLNQDWVLNWISSCIITWVCLGAW